MSIMVCEDIGHFYHDTMHENPRLWLGSIIS
jgi:hypothetical protein